MKKKIMLFLVVATMGCTVPILADNGVSVLVDGESIDFTQNQPPVIKDGTTLVPFRAVFEKLGAYVEWTADKQLCEASLNGVKVSTTIGDKAVYVNSLLAENDDDATKIDLAVPAQIINGRTMVPLRVLSESLGLEVDWDSASKTVNVSSKKKEKAGNYTYVMEDYVQTRQVADGTNYLYASATYPQFEGDGVIASLNTQIENSMKKNVDSFANSYDKAALEIYNNPPAHLFEPPYTMSVFSEVSCDGDIVTITSEYHESKYDQDDDTSTTDVLKINMKTGEVVE